MFNFPPSRALISRVLKRLSRHDNVAAVKPSQRLSLATVMLAVLVPLLVSLPSGPAAAGTHDCRAPRVVGLTVTAARSRAALEGCRLRLAGAPVTMADIQSIRAQRPGPGHVTGLVTAIVNPLCPSVSNIGPPSGEPLETPGPTELDTGLFIEGGAFVYRSAPNCKDLVGTSSAGTITVTSAAGTVVAHAVLTAGQLLKVTLAAGRYEITGVFANGDTVGPTNVTVPAGETVRQDLVLDVP